MSQATAKATRRQIRRVVGPHVVETIQQHEDHIAWLINAVRELQARVTSPGAAEEVAPGVFVAAASTSVFQDRHRCDDPLEGAPI